MLSEGHGRVINLIYIFSILSRVTNAVWNELPLTLLVHMTTNSDLRVGVMAGVAGLSQLLAAPLAAYFADNSSRSGVLRTAGVLTLLAIATTMLAVITNSYSLLLVSMSLWGFSNAAAFPTCDAVIADTVPAGERSGVYTMRSQLMALGSGVGPAVSLGMFAILGDRWRVGELRSIIYTGLVLSLAPAAVLFMFPTLQSPASSTTACAASKYAAVRADDPEEVDASSGGRSDIENAVDAPQDSAIGDAATDNVPSSSSSSSDCNDPEASTSIGAHGAVSVSAGEVEMTALVADTPTKSDEEQWNPNDPSEKLRVWVPYVIVMTDINSMLASGMSVKFFAVFFKENMHMTPTSVTIIMMVRGVYTAVVL
jgi:hypothetical protein